MVVLFVYLFLLENFSLTGRRHHYRQRTANFDLCLALMATEHLGFFSMSHLLWYGASIYNGHLEQPVTLLSYCHAFGSRAVTTGFNNLGLSWLEFKQPAFCLQGERSNPLCHHRSVMIVSLFSTPMILITNCLYSIYRWRWWSYPCSVLQRMVSWYRTASRSPTSTRHCWASRSPITTLSKRFVGL